MANLDNLAWVALAGNPVCPTAPIPEHPIETTTMDTVQLGAYLGEGASGEVFSSSWKGKTVAVKLFKADVSPDGRSKDEIDVACFVDHPNLTRVVGSIETPLVGGFCWCAASYMCGLYTHIFVSFYTPTHFCTTPTSQALIKELVTGKAMADKPNFVSLLRCRWRSGLQFRPRVVLRVAGSVARALRYMHAHGICHGDVYAHNVLADADGNAVVCDYGTWWAVLVDQCCVWSMQTPMVNANTYGQCKHQPNTEHVPPPPHCPPAQPPGASFFYDPPTSPPWEKIEVRAFGLFLKDLVDRYDSAGDPRVRSQLQVMVHACCFGSIGARPTFDDVCKEIDAMLADRALG